MTLGAAIIIIAQLGGYLNRPCDGVPGFECLRRGYTRFSDMVKIRKLEAIAQAEKKKEK